MLELSAKSPKARLLQAWDHRLQVALIQAGASWDDCAELVIDSGYCPEVAKMTAKVVQADNWTVSSVEDMNFVRHLLPHRQPCYLHLAFTQVMDGGTDLHAGEIGIDQSDCTPVPPKHSKSLPLLDGEFLPSLLSLLEMVRCHHLGQLSLQLHHSFLNFVPCTDVIAKLHGARSGTYQGSV